MRITLLRTTLLLCMLLLLTGCLALRPPSSEVRLGRGATYQMAAPTPPSEPVLLTLTIEIQKNDKPFRFKAYLEAEKDRLVLVGMTPVSSRGFQIVYTKEGMAYEHLPFYRLPIRPDDLLALLEMAWWPESKLGTFRHLKVSQPEGDKRQRRVDKGQRPLIVIDYEDESWPSAVTIRNHARNYTVVVKVHQVEK